MSRTPNLTPEQVGAIEVMISQGLPQKHAVAQLGLSYNTFRKQLERGARDIDDGVESIFADLARAVAKGRATKVAKWVEMLHLPNRHGELDGASIRFLLERTEPKDFGPSSKVEVDANVTQRPPREEMDALLAKVAASLSAVRGTGR